MYSHTSVIVTDLTIIVTAPEGVATIEPISITTDAIEIRWSEPSGTGFSRYDLSISPNDGLLNLPVNIDR